MLVNSAYIGCSLRWGSLCNIWDPININTTFTTAGTGFNQYFPSNYFYGFSMYISGYDGLSSYGMNFKVSGTTLFGTAYQTGFNYYGNPDGVFLMKYSYLVIL